MKISPSKKARFGAVLGLLVTLLAGCGNGEKLEVFVYFPSDEALQATELLRVQVIEPASGSSCAALLSGEANPGSDGYRIEGEVENVLSASSASWDVGEVGPGRRLFFAQAEDENEVVILHGCTDEQVDRGGRITIDLAETAPPCTQDSECDDSDSCTTDSCEAGECSNQPVAAGAPCDSGDGNPCNATCTDEGVCSTQFPVECDDGELCNGLETCDADDGSCLAGANLPASDYCAQDELVTCDGNGSQTAREICGFGCNSEVFPNRCLRLAPSNLNPELLCSNSHDLVVSAPVTIDTDLGTITGVATEDIVYTEVSQGIGEPAIGVFSFNSITIHSDVTVSGVNALALLSCHGVTISAQINACASEGFGGAGGQDGGRRERDGLGYADGAGLAGASGPQVSSGGGGAGHGGTGGAGGSDPGEQVSGGAGGRPYGASAELIPLLGGSGGGGGGSNNGGYGGGGGGAVQISAGGTLTVGSEAGINACGAGGGPAPIIGGGGGGGGAGGAILLEATAVGIAGILAANGGGGGGGWAGVNQPAAEAGQDGQLGTSLAAGGPGGGDGGSGGAGGAGASGDGVDGELNLAAGGGGGAAGRIHINTLSGSVELPGQVSPDADSGLLTQGNVNTW